MNKLTLTLLFSSMMLVNNYTSNETTVFGPITVVVDQSNLGSNVNNTTTLGGNITVGDNSGSGSTNTITFAQSENILYPVGAGVTFALSIDENGLLQTGNLSQLGSSGNNEVFCPKNSVLAPDIKITTVAYTGGSGTVYPNIDIASAGQINLMSTGLVPYSSGSDYIALSLDPLGNIKTTDSSHVFVFGENTSKNYISVDNASTTGITLSTANTSGAPININAGINTGDNIILTFASPTSSSYSLLAQDTTSGALVALGSGAAITCGNLTATGNIALGNVASGNYITFDASTGGMTINGMNEINLDASGHIHVAATGISSSPANVLLAADTNNDLETSDGSAMFQFGNTSGNYITVDNSVSSPTGVIINGSAVKITGLTGVSALASGYTAAVTIDNTGALGIVVSDIGKKENIKALEVGDDFYNIKPISYTFKGRENSATEFGFAAQELRGTSLDKAVILGADGSAVSIDYKSVFVAAISKFFETRAQMFSKMSQLESQVNAKDEVIADLQKQINQLQSTLDNLSHFINALVK